MFLQNLPFELLFHIIADLPDPCDLKSLYSVNKCLYTLLLPTFTERYSHLQHDITNPGHMGYAWYNEAEHVPNEDSVLSQRQLKYKVLAFIATKNGWNRLVRFLARNHGVSGSNTVYLGLHSMRCEVSIIEMAARKGDYDLVEFLLDHGSDPNCFTCINPNTMDIPFKGSTPLAAAAATNSAAIALLLLKRGACAEFSQSTVAEHPVRVAVRKGNVEVLELLLKMGANPNPASYCSVPELGTLLNAARGSKKNSSQKYEIMKLLIDYGYPVNDTWMPRGNAICWMLDYLSGWNADHEKILRLLCEAGTDIECRNNMGLCPLDIAASQGLMEAAKILMEYGANPGRLCSGNMRSPAQQARDAGFEELARLLEKKTAEWLMKERAGILAWWTKNIHPDVSE